MNGQHEIAILRRVCRFFGLIILNGAVSLSAGCGLSDYEMKLEEQARKQKYLDEEYSLLDRNALKLPEKIEKPEDKNTKKTTKSGTPEEDVLTNDRFFFRVPKGIFSETKEKPVGGWFHYSAVEGQGFTDLFVSIGNAENDKREKYIKDLFSGIKFAGASRGNKMVSRLGQAVNYEYLQQDDKTSTTRIYIYRRDPLNIAIAFRSPVTASSLDQKLDFSLASLCLNSDAAKQHSRLKASQGRPR